jgi:uncharacterized protein YpbB
MEMSFFLGTIVLYCIDQFNGERSVYAILHMLKGKKSSQTIQDAHLFGLTNIYGTFPLISRQQLEQVTQELSTANYIQSLQEEGRYRITENGQKQLQIQLSVNPLPESLSGMHLQPFTAVFWGRLSLLIQTLSHIVHKQNSFYPIQRNQDVQIWVKHFLKRNQGSRAAIAKCFFEELVVMLEKRTEVERVIFVKKITGHDRVGSTFEQIGNECKIDPIYGRLLFLATLHFLIKEAEAYPDQFPYTFSLFSDLRSNSNSPLTHSTKITLKYLQQGKTSQEIANIRRLKLNTIEDHLVEIAHTEKIFPIEKYVPADIVEKIMIAAKVSQSRQLKAIKNLVNDDQISFFQIRLVLAKVGNE